jgi:type VI secretion system protein ImpL
MNLLSAAIDVQINRGEKIGDFIEHPPAPSLPPLSRGEGGLVVDTENTTNSQTRLEHKNYLKYYISIKKIFFDHFSRVIFYIKRIVNKKYRTLKKVPFYIIFDNEDSRKNVFLINSDVDFIPPEMIDIYVLRDIKADEREFWCFTKQAIFFYGAFDNPDLNWIKKLMLMQHIKGKYFLNGLIININLPKILLQTEKLNQAYCLKIKNTIKYIYSQLNIFISIHLVFTHCDQMAGFQEFFKYLKKEERDNTWGITFPAAGTISEAVKNFNDEYDKLMVNLNSVLVELLHAEKNQQDREMLICFPGQMQLCKSILTDFVFHDEYSRIRSMYFVSHMQKGCPHDFVMSTISKKYDLSYSLIVEPPQTEINFFNRKIIKTIVGDYE